jgi:uncharacterized protein YbjQ (UPF0145 family)
MKLEQNIYRSKSMSIYRIITIIFSMVILIGCATGSTIITGEARPPIDLNEVKIYLDPPSQYETIGLIEASSDVEMSRQAAQDRVINELKTRAAKIGANGVLLINSGNTTSVTTGVYSNGFFYSSKSNTITGQGRAIYVIRE